jgi:O-antigen/teichoic acid export membrane protein
MNLVLSIINGFLIVPLYLKYIDNHLYGAWLATGNILVWLTLLDPGIGDVLTQRVSASFGKRKYKEIGYQISSSLVISGAISFICLIISYLLSYYIPQLIKLHNPVIEHDLIRAFQLAACGTAMTLLSFALSGSALGLQKTKAIGIARTIIGISGILFTLVLLYHGKGIYALAYSNIYRSGLSVIAYGFILYVYLKENNIKLRFSRTYFRQFSGIFSYTFIAKLFSTLAGNIDLILVARFLDVNYVTIFELTRRPLKIVQNFINMPSIALLPAFSSLAGEGQKEKLVEQIERFLRILNWLLFFSIFAFLILNRELVILWVGLQYYAGNLINFLICISFLLTTFSYNLSNITYSYGDIKGNSLIAVSYSVTYVLLIYLLGKSFGLIGIIISSIFANIMTQFWYFPKKIIHFKLIIQENINNELKELVKLVLIGVILFAIFRVIRFDGWPGLLLKLSLYSICYIIFLYLLSYKFRKEIKGIQEIINAKIK